MVPHVVLDRSGETVSELWQPPHQDPQEIHIGFSGTRQGMTLAQRESLAEYLRGSISVMPTILHHGLCRGSDTQAHWIAFNMGIRSVGHPPTNRSHIGFTQDQMDDPNLWHSMHLAKSYLRRNRNIVHETTVLIAAPKALLDLGGGTWYTINYSKRRHAHTLIIEPDEGRILEI
jgi:hypothetical protein